MLERIDAIKQYIAEAELNINMIGDKFDVATGENGKSSHYNREDDYTFNRLHQAKQEILQIVTDIQQALEKHNSTMIDLFDFKDAIVLLLGSYDEYDEYVVDSALFYKTCETVGFDSKGFREVTNHYNYQKIGDPLLFALDLNPLLQNKTIYEWKIFAYDFQEMRQLLLVYANTLRGFTNYNESQLKTEADIKREQEEKERQKRLEEQKLQQEQQATDQLQIAQMYQQTQEMMEQMMAMMAAYHSSKTE